MPSLSEALKTELAGWSFNCSKTRKSPIHDMMNRAKQKTVSVFSGCSVKSVWSEPWHDKTNKIRVCPAKTQISLDINRVWSESSLCTQWVAKDPSCLHANSEDSDETGWMPRLIWVFAGRTLILLVLLCHGWSLFDLFMPSRLFFHCKLDEPICHMSNVMKNVS